MPPGHDLSALVAGLTLGATYLLSIGPNKMMIIREALVRGRTGIVASTVLASYMTLLTLSYFLTNSLLARDPALRMFFSWLGVAFMAWFAIKAFSAAIGAARPRARVVDGGESLAACMRRVLAVACVNPLMYLEFFLIPAAVGGTFATTSLRLEFTLGLVVMAIVTCCSYAALAQVCAPLLRQQHVLRAFDFVCGFVLVSMASSLGLRLCL